MQIEHDGRAQSLSAWARELGMSPGGLYSRLRIMPLSNADDAEARHSAHVDAQWPHAKPDDRGA